MAIPVYKVLTEFRFETASAIASMGPLKTAVDGVSNSAEQALISFEKLSLGIIGNFLSGPGGGVLGVLGLASKNAEYFKQSQIGLANVLGKSAGSFADRMTFARGEMERIAKLASNTGISGRELVNFTKTMTPVVRPYLGAAGAVKQSSNLGRVFLKSAPSLGVNQDVGMQQLRRLVTGLQTTGNQLFTVLTQDTNAMRSFIGRGKEFQKLSVSKKMQIITQAFEEFANKDTVDAFKNSLSGQFSILKQQVWGLGSVFRTLGEVVNTLLVDVLKKVNKFIEKVVGPNLANLAFGLEPFMKNIDTLIPLLYQLSQASKDVGDAVGILTKVTMILSLGSALKFLGIEIPIVSGLLRLFGRAIKGLEADLITGIARKSGRGGGFAKFTAGPMTGILGFFNKLTMWVTRLLAPLALLIFVFQLMSRALAIFKINAAKQISSQFERMSRAAAILARVMAILDKGFQTMAVLLAKSPIFAFFFWVLKKMIGGFENLVTLIVLVIAGFQGITFFLMEFGATVSSIFRIIAYDVLDALSTIPGLGGLKPQGLMPQLGGAFGANMAEAFTAGTDDIFNAVYGAIGEGTVLASNTTNIGKVDINNKFKDNLHPDRIAFSLVKQLSSVSQNGRTAHGRSTKQVGV